MDLATGLHEGSRELGVSLRQAQCDQLLEYLWLLVKWNRVYNLTAITEPDKILSYHLLDSLSLMSALPGANRVLDVGSGAGLPGIPLAIAMPATFWVMLDSNARKTRFIRQAIVHCGLSNAQVVKSRVEDYHAPESPDFIVSRAFAPLAEFCESVAHLVAPNTRLLTMKTGLEPEEARQLDSGRFAFEEQELTVPGIGEPRSLVIVQPL